MSHLFLPDLHNYARVYDLTKNDLIWYGNANGAETCFQGLATSPS